MRTEIRDCLAMINHISGRWSGRVSAAYQTHQTANLQEYTVAVDVRDNAMLGGPEKLTPMISAVRSAMAQFPDIQVEQTGQPQQFDQSHIYQVHFTIKQLNEQLPHPGSWRGLI